MVNPFNSLFEKHKLVRRVILLGAGWMAWRVMEWSMDFAGHSPRPGGEIALIVGAITAPLLTLLGAVFAFSAQPEIVNKDGDIAGV